MNPLTQRAMEPSKAAFATMQWDQEVESATAPDGHVRVHQSSPPPFSLGLPSGLARSQQLYMMQRFLNIPATPSYVEKDGGLVLDRVVANVGGKSWWHTLTLRLRAQRAWNTQEFSKGKPHQVLGDPSMYALGGRVRVGFGPNTVLRAAGEIGSLRPVVEWVQRLTNGAPAPDPAAANLPPLNAKGVKSSGPGGANAVNNNNAGSSSLNAPDAADEAFRGRITLQSKSVPFHVVQVDLSRAERYQTPRGYQDGPSHVSAHIASRGPSALNYRVGVRQWLDETLPEFERAPGSRGPGYPDRAPPRRELSAGVSLEHQATLWRGERRPAPPGRRPGGYAALPQRPCVCVGGAIGAVARVPLADDPESQWVAGRAEARHVASATAHCSLGSFQRPVLDYTSIDVRFDAGATQVRGFGDGPGPGGSGGTPNGGNQNAAGGSGMKASSSPMSAFQRAVNFDGRVAVESETLTLAATQQVLGPIRVRAEVRCSPAAACDAARSWWAAFKDPMRARSEPGAQDPSGKGKWKGKGAAAAAGAAGSASGPGPGPGPRAGRGGSRRRGRASRARCAGRRWCTA